MDWLIVGLILFGVAGVAVTLILACHFNGKRRTSIIKRAFIDAGEYITADEMRKRELEKEYSFRQPDSEIDGENKDGR